MEMTTMMKREQLSHQEIQKPQLKTQESKRQEMGQLSLQEQLKPHQWESPWMSIQVVFLFFFLFPFFASHTHNGHYFLFSKNGELRKSPGRVVCKMS